MLPFFLLQSETFHEPSVTESTVVTDNGPHVLEIPFVADVHGDNGPVQTCYSPYVSPHFQELFEVRTVSICYSLY